MLVILCGCTAKVSVYAEGTHKAALTQNTSSDMGLTSDKTLQISSIPTSAPTQTLTSTPSPVPTITPTPTPIPTITPTRTPKPASALTQIPQQTQIATPAPTPKAVVITSFSDGTADICLTFDDGGDKKSVERALKVLKQYGVGCTFFVIGKYLKLYPDLWKSAVEDGHQICNHTQNHKWLTELNNDGVKDEILKWEESATEVLGEGYVQKMKNDFPYLRLPGSAGSNSKRVLGIVQELGYTTIGWNLETYYAVLKHHNLKTEPLEPIAEKVTEHVVKRAKGGSIILLHFNPYDTLKLEEIIKGFFDKQLEMRLLSDKK